MRRQASRPPHPSPQQAVKTRTPDRSELRRHRRAGGKCESSRRGSNVRTRERTGTLTHVATEGAPLDIDLLAASLRSDSADVGAFVEGLAVKLQTCCRAGRECCAGAASCSVRSSWRTISIDIGDERLELSRSEHNAIETQRCRLSGGIVIKSESIDTDAWMHVVGALLSAEAQRSEQTRQALERLLTQ